MSTNYEDHWKRFEESAAMVFPETRDEGGNAIPARRVMVPIMGTGVRAHLLAGVPAPAGATDWSALLAGVAHAAGVAPPAQQGGPTSAFEAIVHQYRDRYRSNRPLSVVEDDVIRRFVNDWTIEHVDAWRDHPLVARRREALLDLQSADRIDLCFDNLLASADSSARRGSFGLLAPETTCVANGTGWERSWHPHGYSRTRKSDLVLGMHRYGRSVAMTLRAFERYMASSRSLGGPPTSIGDMNRHRDGDFFRLDPRRRHWLAAAIDAPVVFLGVGLSASEWDLTWFLQMRARVHANVPWERRPWTFRLLREGDPEIDQMQRLCPGAPVYDLIVKGEWEQAWEKFHFAARAKPTVDVYRF